MYHNHKNSAVKETALLVLTLIAAGEGNHPTVKNALKSILFNLEKTGDELEKNDRFESQPVDVISFKSFVKNKKDKKPKRQVPRLRVFSPENDEKIRNYAFKDVNKTPSLKIYMD